MRIVFFQQGTTSACAENTPAIPLIARYHWNYLRVRGEYAMEAIHATLDEELPPRARRIHAFFTPDPHTLGTTSACAENTLSRW